MLVCVVDEWRADIKVVIVDEWRADVLVAMVDEWRATTKVAIVDEWRADVKVAVVDEWRASGIPSGLAGGGSVSSGVSAGAHATSHRRRSVDEVVPAIGALAPAAWIAISFAVWCLLGIPLVMLGAMPSAGPIVIAVIAIATPPMIAIGSWLWKRNQPD